MAKLNREARLRERRTAKQARKEARRLAAGTPDPDPASIDDGDSPRAGQGDATASEPGNAEQSP